MKKYLYLFIVLSVVVVSGGYLAYLLGFFPEVKADGLSEDVAGIEEGLYGEDTDPDDIQYDLETLTDKIDRLKEKVVSDSEDSSEGIQADSDKESGSDDLSNADTSFISSASDLNFHVVDSAAGKYAFTYNGEEFSVIYVTDNWRIINSYKITSESDMKIICQTLIDEKPVHGRDMSSYRTADDMVYEWIQHNLLYQALPSDSQWKSHAKDVDFDPKDQNRTFEEMYKDRTGKELSLEDFLN